MLYDIKFDDFVVKVVVSHVIIYNVIVPSNKIYYDTLSFSLKMSR